MVVESTNKYSNFITNFPPRYDINQCVLTTVPRHTCIPREIVRCAVGNGNDTL